MGELTLKVLQQAGYWAGMACIGTAMAVCGYKIYERSNYFSTDATVTALVSRCDMSYQDNKSRNVHRMVDCAEAEVVKAQHPDANWTVDRIPSVQVAYATRAGRPLRVTVPLSKLDLVSPEIGQKISILESSEDPEMITASVSADFVQLWVSIFFGGIGMLIGSMWAGRVRERRLRMTNAPRGLALALEMPVPQGEAPFRQTRDRERKRESFNPRTAA